MTPEIVVAIAGILLSVIFEYLDFSGGYSSLPKQTKAAVMAGAVTVVVGIAVLLSCYGPYSFFACEGVGFWQAAELWVLALVANQTTHRLVRKSRTK